MAAAKPSRRSCAIAGAAALGLLILSAIGIRVYGGGENATAPAHARPPWIHGEEASARFAIIFYADLECPHCKAYFPALTSWIERHPQTALQWRHLPLSFHDPAATRLAIMAECAGMLDGNAAFWTTVAWVFQNTLGDGRGLPDGAVAPGASAARQACMESGEPLAIIQAQAGEATAEGIDATPTLKLEDRASGKQLVLSGAVDDDALLSALDLLSSEERGALTNDLPAGVAGMPR